MKKTIKPSMSGREFSIWHLLLNYQAHVYHTEYESDFDPGFRISLINSCWISIEAFLKNSMSETVLQYPDELIFPDEYQPVGDDELSIFNSKLDQIENLNKTIISNSWGKNLQLSTEIGRPIEKKIDSWEFAVNLYRLRNGLVHGQPIKILKSHVDSMDSTISKHYMKALNYLNTKKIIDLSEIIETQNITLLLNRKLSHFISIETANVIDDISNLYDKTFQSNKWKQMRNPKPQPKRK